MREEQLKEALKQYSEAYATPQYSVANFRILNNITDEEWQSLKDSPEVKLIQQKFELNLRNRLLDPNVKASEVTAIKILLDDLNGENTNTGVVINNIIFESEYSDDIDDDDNL